VAQAAHWFDRGAFYAEVKRVSRPGGVLAIWAYEVCTIGPVIDEIMERFYRGPIWPYWPPERRHVEAGYKDFDFPFEEIVFPHCTMERTWSLPELAAYLRTWSSVVRYTCERGIDPVAALEAELAPVWGGGVRKISWPLAGRVGRHSG